MTKEIIQTRADFSPGENGDEEPTVNSNLTRAEKKKLKYKGHIDKFSCKEASRIDGGVIKGRKCTDVLCLIIFFVFIGCMGAIIAHCITSGNLELAISPIDHDLSFCGWKADDYSNNTRNQEGFKKLYFPKLLDVPTASVLDSGYCIESCPKLSGDLITCSETGTYAEECKTIGTSTYGTYTVLGYCFPSVAALEESPAV
jgi:hypothetical protein